MGSFIVIFIPAIISRCSHFRFELLKPTEITPRLHQIADSEGLRYEASQLDTIAHKSKGDMRKAVNLLEMAMTRDGKLWVSAPIQAPINNTQADIQELLEKMRRES